MQASGREVLLFACTLIYCCTVVVRNGLQASLNNFESFCGVSTKVALLSGGLAHECSALWMITGVAEGKIEVIVLQILGSGFGQTDSTRVGDDFDIAGRGIASEFLLELLGGDSELELIL